MSFTDIIIIDEKFILIVYFVNNFNEMRLLRLTRLLFFVSHQLLDIKILTDTRTRTTGTERPPSEINRINPVST